MTSRRSRWWRAAAWPAGLWERYKARRLLSPGEPWGVSYRIAHHQFHCWVWDMPE